MKIHNFQLQLLTFFFILSSYTIATASHNRAGEITIEQIGDLTIRATVTTYTKTSSIPADRDSLVIAWGDGISLMTERSNNDGEGLILDNDIKYNTYIAEHTYSSMDTYIISMRDPNRNGSILNINNGNSDPIPFYIETIFTFPEPQNQDYNNTPQLLFPPIDVAYVGQPFMHNPTTYDIDGDSIAYEFTIPKMSLGNDVTNYVSPEMIMPGPNNIISLNEVTGDILWDAPQQIGEYNIAILIKEYRDNQLISSTVRDMQIRVLEGNNMPPVVNLPIEDEILVSAGDTIEFIVTVTDPDIPAQEIRLSAYGAPFQLSATFDAPSSFQPQQTITGLFRWIIPSENISNHAYTLVFKAEDNFDTSLDTFGLSVLKTVRIWVIDPSVSIKGINELASTKILPNPFNEQFNIEISSDTKKELEMKIYNCVGQLIRDYGKVHIDNTYRIQINAENWDKGIYYLHLSDDKNHQITKLLKIPRL